MRHEHDGIELGIAPRNQNGISTTSSFNNRHDDESEEISLNPYPDSSLQEEDFIPTEPDGDLAEHKEFGGRRGWKRGWRIFGAKYVSLDPTRRLPIFKGRGKWAALAAISTLFVFIFGSAIIALWQANESGQIEGNCPNLNLMPPLGIIQPSSYNISLNFSTANFDSNESSASHQFHATTSIAFKMLQDSSYILLHSSGIVYSQINLKQEGYEEICLCGEGCHVRDCNHIVLAEKSDVCEDFETVKIILGDNALEISESASLELTYEGNFSLNQGLYRSAKVEQLQPTKHTELLLVTQFEKRGARRMFPCIDEPAQKALFNLDITVPDSSYKVLTNTEISGPVQMINKKSVKHNFRTSPKMSTYLIAICVGHPASYSSPIQGSNDLLDREGNKVKTWSLRQTYPFMPKHAYDESVRALEFYTSWTGIYQPLSKFDMVGVPGKSGAMENWGLLLFDESRFQANWDTEGMYGAFRTADVICHEVAHQWFGNLVTAESWHHLTVNEGLASFMEYLCIQSSRNGSQENSVGHVLSQRSMTPVGQPRGVHEGPRLQALITDGQPYNFPLIPNGTNEPDGVITYSKGAAIFSMLYSIIEEKKEGSFQVGLRDFLHKHLYATAKASDILDALNTIYAQDGGHQINVSAYFGQPGIPIIEVKSDSNPSEVTMVQYRYTDYNASLEDTETTVWSIPISIGWLDSQNPENSVVWFDKKEDSLTIPQTDTTGSSWVLNANGKGLYRVLYPEDHLKTLIESLRVLDTNGDVTKTLGAEALVNDIFAFFFKGLVSPQNAVLTAQNIMQSPAIKTPEGEFLLGGAVLDWLEKLAHLINANDACSQDFKSFKLELLNSWAERVTSRFGNSSIDFSGKTALLQGLMIDKVLGEVASAGNNEIAKNLCDYVWGNGAEFAFLRTVVAFPPICKKDRPPGDPEQRSSALDSFINVARRWQNVDALDRVSPFFLAHTEDETLIKITVNAIISQDYTAFKLASNLSSTPNFRPVNEGDVASILEVFSKQKQGAILVWNALFTALEQNPNSDRIWNLLNGITLYPTKEVQTALERLLSKIPAPTRSRAQKQVLDRLRHHVRWREDHEVKFCSIIKQS